MTPRKQCLLDIVRWVYILGYRLAEPDSVPYWEGKMKISSSYPRSSFQWTTVYNGNNSFFDGL